jgi:hypothetical protein
MTAILKFDDAIEHSVRFKKRHLLLGNGFSIACRPQIFTYGSLFEQANFSSAPRLPAVFDAVGRSDFELVIRMLENASRIVPIYSSKAGDAAKQMAADAKSLKDILIQTLAHNHPNIPNDIEDEQFWACRKFLSHFLGDASTRNTSPRSRPCRCWSISTGYQYLTPAETLRARAGGKAGNVLLESRDPARRQC